MKQIFLSIVIPAYNESKTLYKNIIEVDKWVKQKKKISFEILIVNDGSTDNTGQILNKAKSQIKNLKVIHHVANFGRGKAIRTGLGHALGKYIICLDADLSYDPEHISLLLQPLINNIADITLASAHHPKGRIINVPFGRRMLSKFGNKLLSLGFEKKIFTSTCSVRGFKKEVIENLELMSDDKDLHLEVIQKAQLLGYKIKEIPSILNWRDKKRRVPEKHGKVSNLKTLRMKNTILSHLVFNYVSNPGILLIIPIILFLLTSITGLSLLISNFLIKLQNTNDSILSIIRSTLIDGQITAGVTFFSLITLIIFIIFYFLSFQNKYNFDLTYKLLMRMNARIKKIEQNRKL
ncbi:glycosyltransferase family 2 protein [Candidatus Pelagibacter ubique]|nr:glycosyltransferase family 2 protein [Candidatus Pelagibacter ubique]